MDSVCIDQSERLAQVGHGTLLTIMAEADRSILHDTTEVVLLEETLIPVPDERPMRGHVPVLIHPTLTTQ